MGSYGLGESGLESGHVMGYLLIYLLWECYDFGFIILGRSATEYSSTKHPSPFPPFAECIITDCK
jgi:hypothetical protein